MSEIHYKDFKHYLSKLKNEDHAQVYLIYGEEFLQKKVLSDIVNILLPESEKEFDYEKIDCSEDGVGPALENMSTISFLSMPKVVVLFNAETLFSAQANKTESEKDEKNKDNGSLMQKAVEKGFPEKNRLIITAGRVDKRKSVFKTIKSTGVVIDCSVPSGNRMADRKAQEAVLYENMKEVLSKSRKTMDRRAFAFLAETTGFDLGTFANNLEMLVDYSGERSSITEADIKRLIKRTKKDPIFELTGAISERNAENALFYMTSLLEEGLYPLQILSGIINHIRKLLRIKNFSENECENLPKTGISFDYFKSNIMPLIIDSDKAMVAEIGKIDHMIPAVNARASTSLVMAKSPGSPYPVYQMFLASKNFTRKELLNAMKSFSETDMLLKTGAQINPKLILEKMIMYVCLKN